MSEPDSTPSRRLSDELAALHTRAGDRAVTLREVIYVLRGRAYVLLMILLVLPFIQPIPLPGLSTPLGFAIVLIALRLSLGQRPWLPMRIQRIRLPAGFFGRVLTLTRRVIRVIEAVARPRWEWMTQRPRLNQLHAFVLLVAATVLLLPLPIPFSNLLPGWTVFLLACGRLERDGLLIALGYLAFVLTALFFLLLGNVAQEVVDHALHWMREQF